jgi:hypothetical protein
MNGVITGISSCVKFQPGVLHATTALDPVALYLTPNTNHHRSASPHLHSGIPPTAPTPKVATNARVRQASIHQFNTPIDNVMQVIEPKHRRPQRGKNWKERAPCCLCGENEVMECCRRKGCVGSTLQAGQCLQAHHFLYAAAAPLGCNTTGMHHQFPLHLAPLQDENCRVQCDRPAGRVLSKFASAVSRGPASQKT